MHSYPLLTTRKIVSPIWGGSRLANWLELPEPRPATVGETWQVYDSNLVTNGPLAGRSLAELARTYGAALVGTRSFACYGADIPLLAKFIDAADRLSIQVHPDDAYAHSHEAATGFHGKTEAWYILEAAPGADVTYGLARSTGRAEFAAAVQNNSIEALLRRVPVAPGDLIFVPAGTIHAINAGVVLFEIQQKSDLTYRVYDYGRRDARTGELRELHLEKALDVSDFGPVAYGKAAALELRPDRDLLVACASFALERWRVDGSATFAMDPGSLEILTAIDGVGQITWSDGSITLRRGESALLPANMGGCTLTGTMTLLRANVPDLPALVGVLRACGHPDRRIDEVVHG